MSDISIRARGRCPQARRADAEFRAAPRVTIEPASRASPARSVAAACRSDLGADVEFGPFGSGCTVDAALMPDVVAAVIRAAFANGATHVNLDVSAEPGGAP